jgi:hypothetical protein
VCQCFEATIVGDSICTKIIMLFVVENIECTKHLSALFVSRGCELEVDVHYASFDLPVSVGFHLSFQSLIAMLDGKTRIDPRFI